MFKRRTVFIVGAGASAEVGLPLGRELAATISKKMDIRFEFGNRQVGDGDMDIYGHLTSGMQKNVHEYQNAAWLIRDGIQLSRSIDDFLDLHRTDPFVTEYGKAAIVKSILEAERASSLYFGGESGIKAFSPQRFAHTWLVKFTQMLGPGIPRENVGKIFDRVSFIVFNYDRCLEYFLFHALQKLYGLKDSEVKPIVADLDITHPYGVIHPNVPFGVTRANYNLLARDIKTYTEQVGPSDTVSEVATKIQSADHIVFLGFAYHDQNMSMLQPLDPMPASKSVIGTAFGMSDADVNVTSHQIDAWFQGRDARAFRSMIKLENNLKCAELFDYYAKSLTGG